MDIPDTAMDRHFDITATTHTAQCN